LILATTFDPGNLPEFTTPGDQPMPTLTIHYDTEAERVGYERAIAFVAELRRVGLDSPSDRVFDACEGLALERGRDLIRDSLASAIQAPVDGAEPKGAMRTGSDAAIPVITKGDAGGRS
jgi:hypothetical protein